MGAQPLPSLLSILLQLLLHAGSDVSQFPEAEQQASGLAWQLPSADPTFLAPDPRRPALENAPGSAIPDLAVDLAGVGAHHPEPGSTLNPKICRSASIAQQSARSIIYIAVFDVSRNGLHMRILPSHAPIALPRDRCGHLSSAS
jgi:hypothetical protein